MNNDYGNTLLKHCGEPEIPSPAVRTTITDAICAGELTQEIESLRRQNAALEEANKALGYRVVALTNELRERDQKIIDLHEPLAGREFE